jgi:hypothetical protein
VVTISAHRPGALEGEETWGSRKKSKSTEALEGSGVTKERITHEEHIFRHSSPRDNPCDGSR